ncbi:Vps51/Vps67-domain-containing protein [Suillus paluster]|uniref:Vps51/Vps67-domain-containing protein n=1 Tax=Suillus paluster TaxID=48578 RepID=UPI001B876937|nr:Vps51/Vps67-domain-containing protein [Suillus paluster]KAG1744009.1 Vps51/Vps67-domain-containing protein [Suillus paluster]
MSTSQSTPSSPTAQRVKSVSRVLSSPLRPTSSPSPSTLIPSNSRRSSLGVGQTSGTKPPTGPVPKTRARDLLRKHYGLGVGPPTPLPGRSNDPMDLDSTTFDAKSYYEQLITTSSLSALLKRENDLLTEIRQLDGERQSLVYNHHHELIAASDTIAAMKTRAEGLDADLDLLKAAFSEISRLGAKVSVEKHPSDINPNQ